MSLIIEKWFDEDLEPAGAGGISANLNETLDNLVGASTVVNLIGAATSQTLATLAGASAVTVAIDVSTAKTLADVTLGSAAGAEGSAATFQTLGALSPSSEVDTGIAAALSALLEDLASAAEPHVEIRVSTISTLEDVSLSSFAMNETLLFAELEEGASMERARRRKQALTPEPPLNIPAPVDISMQKEQNDVLSEPAASASEVVSALRRVAIDTVPVIAPTPRVRPVAPAPQPKAPQPEVTAPVVEVQLPEEIQPEDIEMIAAALTRIMRQRAYRGQRAAIMAALDAYYRSFDE
jgi:hypothetical protein